ncbi:MAG: DMT family transporter [Beijerinckiaceae bacterium]
MSSDRSAIALATLAILLLTIMDALIKSLAVRFDAFQIMFFRTVVGVACTGTLFAMLKPGWPSWTQVKDHAVRSAIMMVTGLMFFHALGRMPLAELFVYTFTAPMFVALFGSLILKERLSQPVIIGLALGFSGILVILLTDPNARFGGGSLDGQIAGILSPITYAFAMVLLRKQAGSEPVPRIIFMQSLLIGSIIIPLVAWRTPFPQEIDLYKIIAVGVLGTAGNYALTTAFSKAEAAKVAVAEYTGLIWAALIGYAFFSETPRQMVWVGALLVVFGCLAVARGKTIKPVSAPDAV